MFGVFLDKLFEFSKSGKFLEQTQKLSEYVDSLNDDAIKNIVRNIGTIPENIKASSSEEKLFSKASDIILAKSFRLLGMDSRAISERGDSADVVAKSFYHGYSLVADAKCFRLSRTAKKCFMPKINEFIAAKLNIGLEDFYKILDSYKYVIINRAHDEIKYCTEKLDEIRNYSKEQAINELIKETKLEEKISVITDYISSLGESNE